jgi:hypothetical protein
MAMPNDLPFENAPDIQHAMQWTLDDIFNNKEPVPEFWDLIPKGPAMEAFQELRDALPNGGVGVQKVFRSITSGSATD